MGHRETGRWDLWETGMLVSHMCVTFVWLSMCLNLLETSCVCVCVCVGVLCVCCVCVCEHMSMYSNMYVGP